MKRRGVRGIPRKALLSGALAGFSLSAVFLIFYRGDAIPTGATTEGFPVPGTVAAPHDLSGSVGDQPGRKDADEAGSFVEAVEGTRGQGTLPAPSPVTYLVGTGIGLGGEQYAVLANREGSQAMFRVGDRIFGIGILTKIEKDDATITFDDGETIVVPRAGRTTRADSPSTSPTGGQRDQTKDRTSSPPEDQPQQALDALSSRLTADGTLTANIVEGGQQGFVLNGVKPDGIFARLGLEEGDVVTRVNHEDISNIPSNESAYSAFAAFVGEGEGRIEVIRNGVRRTMNFHK